MGYPVRLEMQQKCRENINIDKRYSVTHDLRISFLYFGTFINVSFLLFIYRLSRFSATDLITALKHITQNVEQKVAVSYQCVRVPSFHLQN